MTPRKDQNARCFRLSQYFEFPTVSLSTFSALVQWFPNFKPRTPKIETPETEDPHRPWRWHVTLRTATHTEVITVLDFSLVLVFISF